MSSPIGTLAAWPPTATPVYDGRLALRMLRFYKSAISPLLPPSCRFLPTCSEYAMGSYKRFGVWKGTVLTAWRLLRCAPWGPKSITYEPPNWPPPGLERLFPE